MRLTLDGLMALPGPGQLAKQGANVSTSKGIDDGGLSHAAAAEQLQFDAGQSLLISQGG